MRRYLRKYLSLGSYPGEWSRSKSRVEFDERNCRKNEWRQVDNFFFFFLQRKILGFDKWKILIFTGNLVFLILT